MGTPISELIERHGTEYTSSVWKRIRHRMLTLEEAKQYLQIQEAHIRLTGYELPQVKGQLKPSVRATQDTDGKLNLKNILERINNGHNG